MRRAEFGQSQITAQPDQRGLRDVAAARHGGQEVRLVHHDNVVVAVEHRYGIGHRNLIGQVSVEIHVGTCRHLGVRAENRASRVDHLTGEHLGPGSRAESPVQLVGDVAALQTQSRRSEYIAHRRERQVRGTGSRISDRASGAAIRSASAEASSGWACERTSASTRAM